MRLMPKDILDYLGFAVPEDGIEISGDDAFLFCQTLSLFGKTMNPDRIPSEDLRIFQKTLVGLAGGDPDADNQNQSANERIHDLIGSVFKKMKSEGSKQS